MGREPRAPDSGAWLSVDFCPRAGPALGVPFPRPPVSMDLSERITVIEPHPEGVLESPKHRLWKSARPSPSPLNLGLSALGMK